MDILTCRQMIMLSMEKYGTSDCSWEVSLRLIQRETENIHSRSSLETSAGTPIYSQLSSRTPRLATMFGRCRATSSPRWLTWAEDWLVVATLMSSFIWQVQNSVQVLLHKTLIWAISPSSRLQTRRLKWLELSKISPGSELISLL